MQLDGRCDAEVDSPVRPAARSPWPSGPPRMYYIGSLALNPPARTTYSPYIHPNKMSPPTQQEKQVVQHNELQLAPTNDPGEGGEKTLPAFAAADAEVAKYLDPTVVIDDETNRRIKSLINRRILPFLVITYFFQTCELR